MKFGVLGACALLLCSGAAHAASPTFYPACDGYGAPNPNGDGMTKEATGLLGSASTRRSKPPLGANGIAACDQALADARLIDKHWLRRASLLRARALHDLAASRPDEALKDLDRAVAAVREPNDPFVKRSLLLGVDFIRGYALAVKGDRTGATRLIAQALVQRPFDRGLALAAMAVLGDDRAVVNEAPLAHEVARLDPRLVDLIVQAAFDRGEFDRVVALDPHLKAPTRSVDIGVIDRWREQLQDARKDIAELRFAADRSGRLAYALAALGRVEEAKAALVKGRADLDAATPAVMPPPPAGEKEGSKNRLKRSINEQVIQAAVVSDQRLQAWDELARLRMEVGTLDPDAAKARVLSAKIPAGGVGLDLLKLMKARFPADQELGTLISGFETKLNTPAAPSAKDAEIVFNALPHTELATRIATYRKANSGIVGFLWGGVSGFKTIPDRSDPNRVTVQFTGEKSSDSVVEEMALLRAADYAREHGRSGFVILERRDYERTVDTTYYGTTVRTAPGGYSTHLDIELVDMNRLPERYREASWRVIPVDQVVAHLAPVYMAAPTAAAGSGQ